MSRKAVLTPEELARNEQVAALIRNRAAGGVPRRMPNAEIDQLIAAAEIIGGGRAEGLSDGQTIQRFVRQLVNENDRRQGGVTGRANQAEAALKAAGLAPDDLNAKNAQELLADEAEFGFAYEDDAMKVVDGGQRGDAVGDLRGQLREAKNIKNKKARARAVKAIERDLAFKVENQKNFDFGLARLEIEGGGRPETVIPATTPRDIQYGPRDFAGEPKDLGRDPRAQVKVIQDQGGYIEFGIDPRERGRFVQRGAEIYTDDEGIRRVGKPGDLAFEQGGGFIEGPNGRIQIPARRVKAERDEQGRPKLPRDVVINKDTPVGLSDTEQARLNEQDRAMGQSAAREFERYERGDLTPSEMANRARLDAARATNEVFVKASGKNYGEWENDRGARPVQIYKDQKGVIRGIPREGPAKREVRGEEVKNNEVIIQRHPFNPVTPEDAQAAVLGQLQERKEANRAGRRERIQAMNMLDAVDEANQILVDNNMPGQSPRAEIAELGQIKGDRLKKDMGLKLGDQRATPQNAIRVENADGSYEFVDRAGNPLATPTAKTSQAVNLAEQLNAPDGANNVVDFIEKNQFEDRGAQFFGDESVLGQMADKGAGGGIEQVDIQGALRGIEEKVAARLGIDPKRIRGAKGFQAAMNAINEDERRRGNAPVRLENGEKVRVSNPGVEEALLALKVQPREAKQIANALYQKEMAQFDRPDMGTGPYGDLRVRFGVNDPKRGGDRLDIAKDVKFQGKAAQGVDNLPPEKRDAFYRDIEAAGGTDADAAKPFVGRLQGDRAFGGFNNVLLGSDGQAMDPVDVRIGQEERVRQNREKKVANAAKRGKKQVFGPADDRADVAKIRQMQEGNVFAAERAKRAAVIEGNRPYQNVRGEMVTPTQRTVPGEFAEPRVGFKKVVPGLKRKGDAELLPRPKRPTEPRVEDAGEGFANVKVPEGFVPRSRQETVKRREEFRDRAYSRIARRDAGIIGGAALATILGLNAVTGNEEEEEQF